MAYTPINTQAYTAAFSGAVAGMAVNGWITSPTGSNYTLVCAVAGAFAQAFDVAWNNAAAINGLEYSAIQSVCAQEFSNRGPGPLASAQFQDPANWEIPAKACATLALQCDLYFAGQGITPPPISGGGGGFQQGNLGWIGMELSEATPGPLSQDVTMAAQADVGSFTKVTFSGRAFIALTPDETGSPSLSDGTVRLDVAWNGVDFDPGPTFLWGGGGPGTTTRIMVPLYAFNASGPATGDPMLRLVFNGEPVGGSEGLIITLDSIEGTAFFSN
jgi:hypothetical protein